MIVVAGEALVDRVVPDHAGGTTSYPGGSPLNVAVGLGRLGVEVTLVTELGDDADGQLIRGHLQDAGVRAEVVQAARTSSALADLNGPEPVYDFDLSWTLPTVALPPCAALHVGSLAVLTAPGRDGVADLVAQALAAHSFVSYDLNLRSGDLDVAASTHLHAVADAATVVKLSDRDADLLAPGAPVDEIAQAFLGERTRLVVLTRGSAGATAYTATMEVSVPAPTVTVVDTIGAGDAFTAGLLAALSTDGFALPWHRTELTSKLSAAVELAALSCTRAGADPLWRAELRPDWPAASGSGDSPA